MQILLEHNYFFHIFCRCVRIDSWFHAGATETVSLILPLTVFDRVHAIPRSSGVIHPSFMYFFAVHNNPRTRNLNTLLAIMLQRLDGVHHRSVEPAELLSTVNAVFLARTFLKHMIESMEARDVVAQLDLGPPSLNHCELVTACDSFVCGVGYGGHLNASHCSIHNIANNKLLFLQALLLGKPRLA